ncbi:hypothetical protein Fmac_027363 [Flemingia macrophylla]|uniref:Uncharacterized protein n=1 Tax=Flemingia macrophylla TaxID=520843 RepID=A0ABD1LHH8_9FABA
MPTKQVSYRNDKTVLVRVYVEKPRKNRSSSSSIHHQHHIHHRVRREVVHHGSGIKGHDRRAWLLMYSRLLRESARGTSSKPSFSDLLANNPPSQIVPSNKERSGHGEKTSCFGNWKLLIPRFLISSSWSKAKDKEKNKKQKRGTNMLQVWREKSFFPNVFSTKRKRA